MTIFTYHINLDERGQFSADVRRGGCNGDTVFEMHGFDVFEDGFMDHKHDTQGLQEHLIDVGIMQSGDRIGTEAEAEAADDEDEDGEIDYEHAAETHQNQFGFHKPRGW